MILENESERKYMTEQKKSVGSVLAGIGNKILEAAQDYSLDRLVWCIATIALCWTEVQNYHEYIFMLRMYILSGVGAFYCLKLGFFAKGKRILCGLVTLVGIYVTMDMIGRNFYATYKYMNLPLGIFLTVLANLYVLVIWNAIKDRRIPLNIGPSLLLILMLLAKQTSVYDYRQFYLYVLISLLPFIMMKKGYRTRSCMLNGMLDGLCIGFFLIQGYAWMHRPYNYSAIRYTGISNATTTMSRIYLPYFAAWIIRYAQAARQKLNLFNGIFRVFSWLMAAFVLSLEYLTGSRSAVLAMILMTILAVAVRYIRMKDKWWKQIGKLILWPVNCACIGIVSLALFPVAYKSVRYLPAYFNEPVYVDAAGYRSDSVPIQKWGENFGWNYEYDEYAVKMDEEKESPNYASFAESVRSTLGRIIPGTDSFLKEALRGELLDSGLKRAEYYYKQGYYNEEEYKWEVFCFNDSYGTEKELENEDDESTDDLRGFDDLLIIYKKIIEKILAEFVLCTNAKESIGVVEEIGRPQEGHRGDNLENPWYADEEDPGNGIGLRLAIHEYAISKLNLEGHSEGSFCMWIKSDYKQPHAHNIFLIAGYNFGIPTLILMVLLFVVTFLVSMYNAIRFGKTEYLLPALLVAGITVFGWFETGFDYKTGIMMWVFLCVCFTDVLRVKKRKKGKGVSGENLVPQQAAGSAK